MLHSFLKDKKRFKSKYKSTTREDCWYWNAYCEPKMGYGRFVWKHQNGHKEQYAHRFAFLMSNGYLPVKPNTVDHKCRNPACVNPNHLREATPREQMDNSENICKINSNKTSCKRGHLFNNVNTFYHKDGRRECKICRQNNRRKRENYKGILPSKERTHCPYGHKYSIENTLYINRPNRNTIERQCKTCKKIRRSR